MTRYLTVDEVLDIHDALVTSSGGGSGVRDWNGLESAVAQPQATFDGKDLNPTFADKGCALAFSLIKNHPFVDGNKRIGHAAMEMFLLLNDCELQADVDESEKIILGVADGSVTRDALLTWILQHLIESKH